MVFCQNDGGSCLNENDNPHDDGSTICKQLYKTQKLLAIDQKGRLLIINRCLTLKFITTFYGQLLNYK
jgi:hypothetical protein